MACYCAHPLVIRNVFIVLAVLGDVIHKVSTQPDFQHRPIWGTGRGRPAGKTCLDFCQLFPVCNHGKCFLDDSSCTVLCDCNEGYTGRWCKDKERVESKDDEKQTQNSTRQWSNGNLWSDRSSASGTTKRPLGILGIFSQPRKGQGMKPPLRFPPFSSGVPSAKSDNKPVNKTIPGSKTIDAKDHPFVLPNNTTITIIRNNLEQIAEDEESTTNTKINEAKETTTKSFIMQTIAKSEHLDDKADIVGIHQPSKITSPEIPHSDAPSSISEISNPNGESEDATSIKNGSLFSDCEKKCEIGQCLLFAGEYKCVRESFPLSHNASSNTDETICSPGFQCEHGVCDQEQRKQGRIKCICDKGWTGTLCQHNCQRDCGIHGECVHLNKNKTATVCLCHVGYIGDRCETYNPFKKEEEESPLDLYVIAFTVGFPVLVILIIGVMAYIMWRRRLVFIMKIVHYFQHYEEDDGHVYDAFISYKSSKEDEKFVLTKLYPKLELEMGFKLCMHFRDFTPGEAIANNIISAIEKSRRTIMVLSPNYINSEWCRMEYQKAQHEMLKMRHKIIPIVLDDISKYKTLDKNLKTILSTVTYIDWPGEEDSRKLDKFWKKIELSLPKKRSMPLSEQSRCSSIESTSTTSTMSDRHVDPSINISEEPPSSFTSSDDNNFSNTTSESIYCISDNNESENSSTTQHHIPSKINRSESRLKKMKDVLKLKINNNNNRVLCREMSVDSNISTPISATPSPGFFGGKDSTPLLSKKILNSKQMNGKNGSGKPSTWSHRNHRRSRKNSQTQSQSFTERDHNRPGLDVIPQTSSTTDSIFIDLPDVCRTGDCGYYNILCGEGDTTSSFSENNLTGTQFCQTCVHRKDSLNANSNICHDNVELYTNPNILNDMSSDKQTFNIINDSRVSGEIQNNISSVGMKMNINVDQYSVCPTCVHSYSRDGFNANITDNSHITQNCPTCVLKCNVDNFNAGNVTENTSGIKMMNIAHTDTSLSGMRDSKYEHQKKISNIQHNENPILNVMEIADAAKNFKPNFHVNNAFAENVENNNSVPIPPVRIKKLRRINSRDNLSEF